MKRKPIPPLTELRAICQNVESTWYSRHIARPLSIRLTWLLLHTPITANGVTVLQLLTGIAGGFLIMQGNFAFGIIGILLVELGYIIDCSDGEVARYYDASSKKGVFLDIFNHVVVISFMFFTTGLFIQHFIDSPLFSLAVYSASLLCLSSVRIAQFEYLVNTRSKKGAKVRYQLALSATEQLSASEGSNVEVTTPIRSRKQRLLGLIRSQFIYPYNVHILQITFVVSLLAQSVMPVFLVYTVFAIGFLARDSVIIYKILRHSNEYFTEWMDRFAKDGVN